MIEICTVSGYNEVGRNCTAVRVDDEVVILDMGVQMDKYVEFTDEQGDISRISPKTLMHAGAIPNINLIKDWWPEVLAIIPSHAHLDHIGAIPFLANRFNADIICTPFTKALLEAIMRDNNFKANNDIISVTPNSTYKLSDKITVEFVHVTHSVPQSAIVVLHTPYGAVVYTDDFKLDLSPILGKKTNTERLAEIGKGNVRCVVLDALYAKDSTKTASEAVAKELLRDVMLGTDATGRAIVLTTFSSHLARLKSAIEFGRKLNRHIVFLGRSLVRYVKAGEISGVITFNNITMVKFKDKMKKLLAKIEKDKGKYLIICTGHQGEQTAVLSKIADDILPFKLEKDDHVIFSCKTIPAPINLKNRERLEAKLKKKGVRIFKDIHASGHGSREDHRELISLLNPEHLIPSHGPHDLVGPTVELVKEMGIPTKVHLMVDGKRLKM